MAEIHGGNFWRTWTGWCVECMCGWRTRGADERLVLDAHARHIDRETELFSAVTS